MADYTVITDFAAKDALLTGNPAKAGKGTEISAELDAIAIAIASKVDETSGVLTTPQINDTSADHQYVFAVNELGADRTVTLPLLTGNDEFVFKDHAVTLTNKTVDLTDNTLTGTKAEFNSACSDGDFLFVGDVAGGDVTGPASSTDNAIARFDSTTGKLLQNSAFVVDDSGYVTSFGGQIKFPASMAASADANTLDDYEEGTFTPTIDGSTSAGVGTYSVQTGSYIKIGRKVQVVIALTWSAHTGTGVIKVSGLPFACSNYNYRLPYNCENLALSAGSVAAGYNTSVSSTTGFLNQNPFGTAPSNATVPIDTAAALNIDGTYFTA